MSDVVTIAPRAAQAKIDALQLELRGLEAIMRGAYQALVEGRRGDALNLLRPKTVTAPIAASGDTA